jgi:hypothetical protein
MLFLLSNESLPGAPSEQAFSIIAKNSLRI